MVHFEVLVKRLNQKNLYEHRNSAAGSQNSVQHNFCHSFQKSSSFLLKVLITFPMQINQNSALFLSFSLT